MMGMTRWTHGVALFAMPWVSTACGEDPRDENPFTTAGTETDDAGLPGTTNAATSGAADGTGDATRGDDGSDDDGPKLDVGSADTGGIPGACTEGETCNCTAVDVLFVIDNSGTMCTKQEQLAAAFPDFATAMFGALPSGTDLHVGITTSGFALGGSHSENNCVAQESLDVIEDHYVRPAEGLVDDNGLQGRLFSWEGLSYFAADTADPADEAALASWFTGAATAVDCGVSSFEFNASGAAWALHPDNAAHNAGFLRDEDAVLVLFILTDEGDQSTEVETMQFLHDTVTAAKAGCGGDACIVTGGLLPAYCPAGTNGSLAFLESFGGNPTVGDIGFGIGMVDYAATVGDTFATVVAQTCDDIVPEG